MKTHPLSILSGHEEESPPGIYDLPNSSLGVGERERGMVQREGGGARCTQRGQRHDTVGDVTSQDALDGAAVEPNEDLGTHDKSFQSPDREKVVSCPLHYCSQRNLKLSN